MSETTQSKSPFAGHLRASEQVMQSVAQSPSARLTPAVRLVGVILGAVILVLLNAAPPQFNITLLTREPASSAIATVVILGVLYGVYWLWKRANTAPRVYAITTERLLYRRNNEVLKISLDSVPSVSVFAGSSGRGTLSFGAFFPMWTDVRDAQDVKDMIESAQKQYLRKTRS